MTRYNKTRLGRLAGMVALVSVFGLAGCDLDSLLDVKDPETVNPGTLEDPEVIEVVIAGAEGDFASAFGGGDSYVTVDGLMSDQLFSSGSFPTRTATDQRIQWRPNEGNTSDDIYNDLQFARRALREASARVADHADYGTASQEYQELKALEGYSYVLLGEGFCSAVPLSYVDTESGEFVYEPPSSSQALLQQAVSKFDEAIAGGSDPLARVGKGRALLALGDYAAAAAAVNGVPTTWERNIFFSQSGINNPVYSLQGNGRYSQSHVEGINGLPYRDGCEVTLSATGVPDIGAGVPAGCDPRTPWYEDPAGGFTPTIPLYRSLKYDDYDSPIVLASGVEARLIEAEALMESGDYAGMTGILNTLRQSADEILVDWIPNFSEYTGWALPDLSVPGDRATAVDQLFAERGFWLFLSGHRLGDLRRLVYQKNRGSENVYPTGPYHKGGDTYGPDVVFPLDFDEAANENFDHSMCNVESAAIS